ncbi:MAG: sulfotransferase [Wenzhouxiangellaceae bacterium]|nr:sulfotransferase [Wenzhouxiangellaceae bacterium]
MEHQSPQVDAPTGPDLIKQAEALLKQQRFGAAVEYLDIVLQQTPDDRQALYLLAVCRRMQRRYDEAEGSVTRLQQTAPDFGRGWQEAGHLHRDRRNFDAALAAYERAVAANPGLAASWRFLAEMHRKVGSSERAQIAEANHQRLQSLPAELVSVTSMLHEGQLYRAERLCRHFLNRHPHHPEAMRLLAVLGMQLHIYDDAEFLLESVLEIEPDFDRARTDYIKVLHKRQKFARAFEQATELRRRQPGNPAAELAYANQAGAVGRYDEALAVLDRLAERARERAMDRAAIELQRGHVLKTIGRHDDAVAAYRAAVEARPGYGDAWWSLANMKTFRFDDDDIKRMRVQVDGNALTRADRYHLNFALGKALEDDGEFEASFVQYRQGNALKHDELDYSADRMQADFERQQSFFDPARVERLAGLGDPAPDPIFIVGLPRAGSTLIEQILASHSQVDGTLELPNILAIAHRLGGRLKRGETPRYPAVLADLPAERLAELGRQYLDETRVHRQQAPFFTDKMPNNFRHIGLILSILPNARIIDARRSPMACCFSGFKQLFAEGQEFSYSLSDIGRYYRGYVELMNHWRALYPESILQIDYEDVVADLEGQVRCMLEFLGLPFESACVEYHRTRRSVRTASSEQVRQPIYRAGLEQWRNFDPWLHELRDALGPLAGQ